MEALRPLVRRGLIEIDRIYHRARGLEQVGPLLYLQVKPGTTIGRLHFNNVSAASIRAAGRVESGIRFARLLRKSLADLAVLAISDLRYAGLQLYEGVTWFRPHGSTVGFETELVPPGLARGWMRQHFRLLIWSFAPAAQREAMSEVEPRVFRITRQALIEHFGSKTCIKRASGTQSYAVDMPAAGTST